MTPYYADDRVTLYLGDCRTVLPQLDVQADCVCTDPPYGETSLAWDRWPDGWPTVIAAHTRSMWCFGSLRMFLDRRDEFGGWKLSQDVVWEKTNPTSLRADRFRRIHEIAAFFYQGPWGEVFKQPQRSLYLGEPTPSRSERGRRPAHWEYQDRPPLGELGWEDDGSRLMTSVLRVRGMHMRAYHPNEKPPGILDPLISYACPPGGLVLDPFAGSGSTLVAARDSGRRAIGIEADERYCEVIARRLAQDSLFSGVVS